MVSAAWPATRPVQALTGLVRASRARSHGIYPRLVPVVSDRQSQLGELPVFWREAPVAEGVGNARPVYLHGVPTSSDDWLEFLARTGGLAPDLPGFGRSGKPGHFDYTIDGYADFLERYFELVGTSEVSLVMHDWGAVGLAYARRHPERINRLVLIDAVPFLPGYRWHRTARMWRTPIVGELVMGATTRWVLRISTRESNATPGPMPEEWLDAVLDHLDQGTQRAILRLYRSSPPEVLAQAGAGLAQLTMPALVIWGARDPYIPAGFARAYAQALGHAELIELPDAGHWPWLDRPEVIDRVAAFLGARAVDAGTGAADDGSGGADESGSVQ
jgi:pimeloyl-ACP methyl ester carboxylesterase